VNALVGRSSACAIGSVGRGFGMMTTTSTADAKGDGAG